MPTPIDPTVIDRYVARYPWLKWVGQTAKADPKRQKPFIDAACRLEAPESVSIVEIYRMTQL